MRTPHTFVPHPLSTRNATARREASIPGQVPKGDLGRVELPFIAQKRSRSKTQSLKNPVAPKTQSLKNPVAE